MARLGVNIDHVATVRQARGGSEPVPVAAALLVELGGGEARTTNNRMEIRAALEALKTLAAHAGPLRVVTDSSYMIDGLTKWLAGWRRKGWTTSTGSAVLNRDLWEELDAVVRARGSSGVRWHRIPGHAGIPGNERCDKIAVAFSRGRDIELYGGPLEGYGWDLAKLPASGTPAPKGKERRKAPKGPGIYLSLLDGKLERHATWAECSARVHGRPARFKKVCSVSEEVETLKAWGLS